MADRRQVAHDWLRPSGSYPTARHRQTVPPSRRSLRGVFRRPDAHRRNWLLLIPITLPLVPALYNRIDPVLFGLPFYYWSQLGFAFLASAVITYVHLRAR